MSMHDTHSPGLRLRLERVARGLEQKEFAELLGSSQPSISRIERGIRTPDDALRKRIAEVFGLPEECWGVPESAADDQLSPDGGEGVRDAEFLGGAVK